MKKKKEENLNKTVAKFTYKRKKYEIDWLTDALMVPPWKTYHLYGIKRKEEYFLHEFESKFSSPEKLIEVAIEEINDYPMNF